MKMEIYEAAAMRTSPRDGHNKVDNGVLGLIGESGELVDVIKKYKYQSGENPELPARKIADELGDVLWYLTELADGLNMRLYDICDADFDGVDTKRIRTINRKATPESAILALHDRATECCRAARRGDWRGVKNRMRQMLCCVAHIARMIGYALEEITDLNVKKLWARYPNGFDARISMARTKESMKK